MDLIVSLAQARQRRSTALSASSAARPPTLSADLTVIRRLSQLTAVDRYPHMELARIPVPALLSGSTIAALLECG
jgi:hypothetical protein